MVLLSKQEYVVDLSLSSPYCIVFASSYGEVDVKAHAGAARTEAAKDSSAARLLCKFACISKPGLRGFRSAKLLDLHFHQGLAVTQT